jgi:hypothetical protein
MNRKDKVRDLSDIACRRTERQPGKESGKIYNGSGEQ